MAAAGTRTVSAAFNSLLDADIVITTHNLIQLTGNA